MSVSRYVPGRYPPAGRSPVADKIRERRGARGLTPLDGTLLHVPPVAEGWNSLLGAVRTKGKLPGDIRELMILRVAARNHAMFEWIHHEHVGRSAGLTTPQLYAIRDTSRLPAKSSSILSKLQASALAFADYSTKDVKVPRDVTAELQSNLTSIVKKDDETSTDDQVQDLLVEAAAVVSAYNMVSRFLVSLDVAGMSDNKVPWPADKKEHKIPMQDTPDGFFTHAVAYTSHPSAPWIVLVNSLLTDISMWDHFLPYLLSPSASSPLGKFNVLLHSSRGHGQSSVPPSPATIPQLARDIEHILSSLSIPSVHAVIGVSQGGATALSFGAQFPQLTKSVIACDTGPRTSPGNKEAWAERIELARTKGIAALADATVPRWFPPGSPCFPGSNDSKAGELQHRGKWINEMISRVPVDGFACGAAALQDYDLFVSSPENGKGLLESRAERTLLVAGSLDAGGNIAKGMKALRDRLNSEGVKRGEEVKFVEIEGAGHLPMIDRVDEFERAVGEFLENI